MNTVYLFYVYSVLIVLFNSCESKPNVETQTQTNIKKNINVSTITSYTPKLTQLAGFALKNC